MRSSGRLHCGYCCKCIGKDRCTGKRICKRFQRLNFVQAVNTAMPAEAICFFYIFFQTCLIWPNNSLSGHYPTKINMENILF